MHEQYGQCDNVAYGTPQHQLILMKPFDSPKKILKNCFINPIPLNPGECLRERAHTHFSMFCGNCHLQSL